MSNKHDEIMTYNNIVDTSVTYVEEEIYSILGELGEVPSDFVSTSIMITLDDVLPDASLNDKIKFIINATGRLNVDEITKGVLEQCVSKYITNYFVNGNSIEYPIGALSRMILSELSTQHSIEIDSKLSVREYRNIIEYWVVNILNPVLDYYLNLYSFSTEGSKLVLFHKVNYKIGKHLILSFIKRR